MLFIDPADHHSLRPDAHPSPRCAGNLKSLLHTCLNRKMLFMPEKHDDGTSNSQLALPLQHPTHHLFRNRRGLVKKHDIPP